MTLPPQQSWKKTTNSEYDSYVLSIERAKTGIWHCTHTHTNMHTYIRMHTHTHLQLLEIHCDWVKVHNRHVAGVGQRWEGAGGGCRGGVHCEVASGEVLGVEMNEKVKRFQRRSKDKLEGEIEYCPENEL